MGLFDLFRRPRRLDVRFWLDDPARVRGLVAEVRRHVADGRPVIVVAHFADDLVDVGRRLAEADVPFETVARWTDEHGDRVRNGGPCVLAVLVDSLPEAMEGQDAPRGDAQFAAIATELHVLEDANERVRRLPDALGLPGRTVAFTSFDSPHVRRMAGERVKKTMAMLGLSQDEPIDSPMVTRGVEKALRKLARKVRSAHPATSLAQWIERNVAE